MQFSATDRQRYCPPRKHDMHIERLQELARLLATIPAEKFDLGTWRNDGNDADDSATHGMVTNEQLRNECGTTGCAVGWACAHPPFVAQGLYYDVEARVPIFAIAEEGAPLWRWAAVKWFFGLSRASAEWLFVEGKYQVGEATPRHVADRIESLLAGTAPTLRNA